MKYGPEITQEIAKMLEDGSNRTDACLIADVSYETFTQWMKKPEFSESIKKAEAKCKNRNISIIQKAAITTWQAAAWWLERKHHTEFALKRDFEFTDASAPKKMSQRAIELLKELEDNNVSTNGHKVHA